MGEPSGEVEPVDPDASWRPGFEGWPDNPGRPEGPGDGPDDPVDERRRRWSRSVADGGGRTGDVEPPRTSSAPVGRPSAPSPTSQSVAAPGGADDPPAHRRRRAALRIAALVLVVAALFGAFLLLWPRDGDDAAAEAPTLPETVDQRWTSTFDRAIDDVAVGEGTVVVGASGGLTAFELDTGRQQWSRPQALGGPDVRIDQIGIVDGVVVVQMPGPGTGSEVAAFDRSTGAELWWGAADDGRYTLVDPNGRPLLLRRRRVDDGNVVEVIDPADGRTISDTYALSSVSAIGRNLGVQPATRRVAIWSPDRSEIVAGPVDAFELRSVAPLGGIVVALDLDGRIAAFDQDGVRSDAVVLAAAANGSPDVLADLAGVAPGVAVVTADSSLGFTVVDGVIAVVWQRAGRVGPTVTTERGAVCLLVESTGDEERRETVIDAVDGTTIVAPDPGRERLPTLGRNGYLLAPRTQATDRALDAFDYDGRPLWSLPIAATAEYELLDDAVVVVEQRPGGSVLTVAR